MPLNIAELQLNTQAPQLALGPVSAVLASQDDLGYNLKAQDEPREWRRAVALSGTRALPGALFSGYYDSKLRGGSALRNFNVVSAASLAGSARAARAGLDGAHW